MHIQLDVPMHKTKEYSSAIKWLSLINSNEHVT